MKKIFGLTLSLLLCLCFVSFGACSPSTKLEYNYPFTETTCYIRILSSKEREIVLPDTYKGFTIDLVVSYAQPHEVQNVKSIDFGNTTREIGSNSFEGYRLENICLRNVQTIRSQAFIANRLTEVIIPNTMQSIEDSAFRENILLEDVYFLGNPELGIDTFDHCSPKLVLHGPTGGSVEKYAQENGIAFAELTGEDISRLLAKR